MAFLRYLALLALSIWVGGLVALGGIAAPTIFDVLQTHDPADGRELAGLLFGTIFGRFQQLSWGLAGIVLASLALRAALGPRPRRFAVRMWTVTAMLAISLTTAFVISPRIEAVRQSVPGSVASLPDTDLRKISFSRLHGLSSGLMLLTLLGGLGLMWIETRDQA